jgi:hypothetical protein
MGFNTSVQKFVKRLNDLNRYLLYFPEGNFKQLDQDEIIEILDQAKAPEWYENSSLFTKSCNHSMWKLNCQLGLMCIMSAQFFSRVIRIQVKQSSMLMLDIIL